MECVARFLNQSGQALHEIAISLFEALLSDTLQKLAENYDRRLQLYHITPTKLHTENSMPAADALVSGLESLLKPKISGVFRYALMFFLHAKVNVVLAKELSRETYKPVHALVEVTKCMNGVKTSKIPTYEGVMTKLALLILLNATTVADPCSDEYLDGVDLDTMREFLQHLLVVILVPRCYELVTTETGMQDKDAVEVLANYLHTVLKQFGKGEILESVAGPNPESEQIKELKSLIHESVETLMRSMQKRTTEEVTLPPITLPQVWCVPNEREILISVHRDVIPFLLMLFYHGWGVSKGGTHGAMVANTLEDKLAQRGGVKECTLFPKYQIL